MRPSPPLSLSYVSKSVRQVPQSGDCSIIPPGLSGTDDVLPQEGVVKPSRICAVAQLLGAGTEIHFYDAAQHTGQVILGAR